MAASHFNLHYGLLQLSYFITNTFPFPTQLKNINFFTNSDSVQSTLHVIPLQFVVSCVTSEQRGSSVTRDSPSEKKKFNLEARNVNTNILFTNFGSAIFPELVVVTYFIGIRSSIFLHADPPDSTTLINPLIRLKMHKREI